MREQRLLSADEPERRPGDSRHIGGDGAQEQESDQQKEAATDRDEHRFPGGVLRGGVIPVVSDEQKRGDAGPLPEDEQGNQVRGKGNSQHRPHEREQGSVILHLTRLVVHIPPGVHEDEDANTACEQPDQECQAVDVQRQRDTVRGDPVEDDTPGRTEQ